MLWLYTTYAPLISYDCNIRLLNFESLQKYNNKSTKNLNKNQYFIDERQKSNTSWVTRE